MTLLFIHGAGSSADFWHWQRAAFPRAHYLGLPGHGSSQLSAAGDQLLESYTGWVSSYIEATGLHDVVLNGHSMGGAIVLTLALRRPEWLRAIILTSTGTRLRVSPALLELLRSDYPAAVEAIVQASFARPDGPPSYAQKVKMNGTRRQLLRTPGEVALADYEACDRFDVMERVGEISLPTLCIVGAQDAMVPVKKSEYLHEAIRCSRLAVIDRAGHMLPLEKPEEYNHEVAAFVSSLSTEQA